MFFWLRSLSADCRSQNLALEGLAFFPIAKNVRLLKLKIKLYLEVLQRRLARYSFSLSCFALFFSGSSRLSLLGSRVKLPLVLLLLYFQSKVWVVTTLSRSLSLSFSFWAIFLSTSLWTADSLVRSRPRWNKGPLTVRPGSIELKGSGATERSTPDGRDEVAGSTPELDVPSRIL